jgi:hypothetical protein
MTYMCNKKTKHTNTHTHIHRHAPNGAVCTYQRVMQVGGGRRRSLCELPDSGFGTWRQVCYEGQRHELVHILPGDQVCACVAVVLESLRHSHALLGWERHLGQPLAHARTERLQRRCGLLCTE